MARYADARWQNAAVSMANAAHYSTKAMHREGTRIPICGRCCRSERDFEAYPVHFKRGTSHTRREVVTDCAEIERIPEKHRPPPYAVVTRRLSPS